MTTLREIAEENNLTFIETTDKPNGYPSNIKGAMIGFKSFAQANELAQKYGLTMTTFEKKDGWQLWYRVMDVVFEPFTVSSEDYGDNYNELEKIDELEFLKNEFFSRVNDCTSFEEIEKLLNQKRRIFDEVEDMDDGQIVITDEGSYFETVDKKTMYTEFDTKHRAIGLVGLYDNY